MDPHSDNPLLHSNHFWPQGYPSFAYPTEAPPLKRTKLTHPAAVVCCDQPCPEDDICFQDYCHDNFRTDFCQDPCTPLCHDPCLTDCPDEAYYHNDTCGTECLEACLDECHQRCPSVCTDTNCVDPNSACVDECNEWCTSHYLADCPDCLSSPTGSDIRTPQIPYSFEELVSQVVSLPFDDFAQDFKIPLLPANTIPNTTHICKVKGCMAGAFDDEDTLQDHIEKHHLVKVGDRFVCQWEGCVKKVTKKSNDYIEKEKQARAMGTTYIPPVEPFSDNHLHKLKRHYYVHSGKKAFECSYPGCDSVHATKAQLKVHMARHNPKNFNCEECDKVFTTQNQLKTHVNAVHKKEKHFKCPDCDYACDDSSNMSSHKRKQHQHGIPCPGYADSGCTYKDGRQSEMEKHMRTHHHHEHLFHDKDAFDTYWKREKKRVDENRLSAKALKTEAGLGSSQYGKSSTGRRQHSLGHQRSVSSSTTPSEVVTQQGPSVDAELMYKGPTIAQLSQMMSGEYPCYNLNGF